tara:strand:+ start:2668 stop:3318 length:651 start_codon:yes stop_codon:yes gene_type:complete
MSEKHRSVIIDLDRLNLLKEAISTVGFASFVYTNKPNRKSDTPETARHTIILGGKYTSVLERSIKMLKNSIALGMPTIGQDALKGEAADLVLASLEKSLSYQLKGEQSEDYTKKGLYKNIGHGVNVNTNDGTLELAGMAHAKKVLVEGYRAPVNHRNPIVPLKNKIRRLLPVGKWRTFSLENISHAKIAGKVLVVSANVKGCDVLLDSEDVKDLIK